MGGWNSGSVLKTEGGLNDPWAQRNSHYVFSKTKKQPRCTCLAEWSLYGSMQLDTTCCLISVPQWHFIDSKDLQYISLTNKPS